VFIWAAPIPTRTLSADDVETHMDPILPYLWPDRSRSSQS
jgi:hypothetical protein